MQAIVETLFDAAYLITVITIGILMIRRSKGNVQYTLFGWMAVVLGAGDSFHLIPRALALCTTGLESYTFALGLGKWITSVTMTVFYVLLYYVWRKRYQIEGKRGLTVAMYVLAAARVVLCMMPQNRWLTGGAPLAWGLFELGFPKPTKRRFLLFSFFKLSISSMNSFLYSINSIQKIIYHLKCSFINPIITSSASISNCSHLGSSKSESSCNNCLYLSI